MSENKQTKEIPGQRRDLYINGPLTARAFNMAVRVDGVQRDVTIGAMAGGQRGQLSRDAERRINAALDHLDQELKDVRRLFGDGRRQSTRVRGNGQAQAQGKAVQASASKPAKDHKQNGASSTASKPDETKIKALKESAEATEKKTKTVALKKQQTG